MMSSKLLLAGRLERLLANLIDTLILVVPAGIITGLFQGDLSLLVTFLCNIAYYVGFTASTWQATPGKRLLNMYVVHANGSRISQRDALERFLSYIIPSLPIYASFIPTEVSPVLVVWLSVAWFSPILFTPERIGIHDRLCKTRVVVGRIG